MSGYDIWQHAVQGATREDAQNIDPRMLAAMQGLYGAAPEDLRTGLSMHSAYRSPERQAELYAAALEKYGSPEAARKWVAPPGKSNHNRGLAIDLTYASPEVREWVHANAANHGLAFPLSNEPWHIELAGVRGDGAAAPQAGLSFGVQPTAATTPRSMGVADQGLNEQPADDKWDRVSRLLAMGADLMD